MMRYRREYVLGLVVLLLTLGVFWHARNNKFVNFDDSSYVAENSHVLGGLSLEALRWDFSDEGFTASNWHPLTWLSLQLDVQCFGPNPKYLHQTNVLFHAANAVLLFVLLRVLTGAAWRSAAVALLFALHPLRVESVAWVAERKDVLSLFFALLTLLAYVGYVRHCDWQRRPHVTLGWYLLIMLLFALGLMAKPMLVTLPCILLLLDYWPLWRLPLAGPGSGRMLGRLIVEKLPLFGLTVASCVINLLAQQAGDAMDLMDRLPLGLRLGNALQSYVIYLGKTFWPTNLAIMYPHPEARLNWLAVALAGVLLAAITALAWMQRRRWPYLLVGWFWFVGTLVPVIGLVQVGSQALADRYAYLPHIGLFMAVVWTAADLAGRWRLERALVMISATAAVACGVATWIQIGYWYNSVSLWTHCLEATENNWLAERQLGQAWYHEEHRPDLAVVHFRKEVQLHPEEPMGFFGLSLVLNDLGEYEQAVAQCRTACTMQPTNKDFTAQLAAIETRWGHALAIRGSTVEAAGHFEKATKLCPARVKAHFDLGLALTTLGRWTEAEHEFREARDRGGPGALIDFQLGRALAGQRRWTEAADVFGKALQARPDWIQALCYLAHALHQAGKQSEAEAHYALATRLDPGWIEHNRQTAWIAATHPDFHVRQGILAVESAEQACEATHHRDADCLDALAAAYAETGQFDRAVAAAKQALAVSSGEQEPIRERLELYEKRHPYRDAGAHF